MENGFGKNPSNILGFVKEGLLNLEGVRPSLLTSG